MKDLLMLVVIATFFAMCMAYVAWCDRMIGSDSPPQAGRRTDAGAIDVAEPVADDLMTR